MFLKQDIQAIQMQPYWDGDFDLDVWKNTFQAVYIKNKIKG